MPEFPQNAREYVKLLQALGMNPPPNGLNISDVIVPTLNVDSVAGALSPVEGASAWWTRQVNAVVAEYSIVSIQSPPTGALEVVSLFNTGGASMMVSLLDADPIPGGVSGSPGLSTGDVSAVMRGGSSPVLNIGYVLAAGESINPTNSPPIIVPPNTFLTITTAAVNTILNLNAITREALV